MINIWWIFAMVVICGSGVYCRRGRDVGIVTANIKYQNQLPLQTVLQDSIAHSTEIALESCQKVFKWDRWNCPTVDFLAKRSSALLDRESAFVQSLTAAALIYTVAKNCSRGDIKECGCNHYQKLRHNNDEWTVKPDCSDQVDFSEQMTRSLFEQTGATRLDAQAYAIIHNNRAARIAVRNALRRHCRCHGLSGSCAMQTCWMSLNAFPEIAADIKKMYDRSILLSHDNKGDINTNVREDALAYVIDSSNYCKQNAIPGWKGTIGRQCSRNKEDGTELAERKSCKTLCRSCGHRIRKQTVVRTRRCNCKIKWCCEVTCDICTEHVNEYYCQ